MERDLEKVRRLEGMLEKLKVLEAEHLKKLEATRRMKDVILERLAKEEMKPPPKKFETRRQKEYGGLAFGGDQPTDISKYLTEAERHLFKKRG